MKRPFSENPDLYPRLFDLLGIIWPGIRGAAEMTAGIGATWESVSTPFVLEEDGKIVF